MKTAYRVSLRYMARLVGSTLVRAVLNQLKMQRRAVRVLHLQHFFPEALIALHDLHVVLCEMLLPECLGVLGYCLAAQRDLARSGARLAPGTAPRKAGGQSTGVRGLVGKVEVVDRLAPIVQQ